jgi:hypothetical protein
LVRIPPDAKPKRKYTSRTAAAAVPGAVAAGEAPTPTGFTRAPSGDTIKLMAVARTMPEPISMQTLAIASGMDKKFAQNSINRWFAKGFLSKISRGEFKRTNTFPTQA